MKRRHVNEVIAGLVGRTLGDFWSWAFSDVLSNAARGVLAEYLVAAALGVDDGVRQEWDAVDLRYRGFGIEVKSAAYVQTWAQAKHSTIKFDVGYKLSWDAQTNTYTTERSRSADVYVFCLFAALDRTTADPLHLPDWQFYVMPTAEVNSRFGVQKSVALSRIKAVTSSVGFDTLRDAIDSALSRMNNA
ncbi:MAG: hypothetical protein IPM16_16870 [Chloroflexi bacterium]|nr:hypothetical protein [Chloroflexota bacterium]